MSVLTPFAQFIRQALKYPLFSPFLPPENKVLKDYSYSAGQLKGTLFCPPPECDYPIEADVVKDVEYAYGEKIGTHECPECPPEQGLPKTGQTWEYYPGDDGTYQAGYPKEPPRFIDNGDDTITDLATGLMWQQNGDGFQGDWENAIAYAENLGLGGHTDWRLPNIKELQSIAACESYYPSIDSVFRYTAPTDYWSSTTLAGYYEYAWCVNFNFGRSLDIGKTYDLCYVRCVRL